MCSTLQETKAASGLMRYVYTSSSLVMPHSVEFLDIVRASLINNEILNLTGFLYFDKMYFVQVLEGQEEDIDLLRGKLLNDKRHFGIQELLKERTEERRFGGWAMAFCDGTALNPLFNFRPSRDLISDALGGDGAGLLTLLDDIRPTPPA